MLIINGGKGTLHQSALAHCQQTTGCQRTACQAEALMTARQLAAARHCLVKRVVAVQQRWPFNVCVDVKDETSNSIYI